MMRRLEQASGVGLVVAVGAALVGLGRAEEQNGWVNIAREAVVTANSHLEAFRAPFLVDGCRGSQRDKTYWNDGTRHETPDWVLLTFAQPRRVRALHLLPPVMDASGPYTIRDVAVQFETAEQWRTVADKLSFLAARRAADCADADVELESEQTVQRVRVLFGPGSGNVDGWNFLGEIRVIGWGNLSEAEVDMNKKPETLVEAESWLRRKSREMVRACSRRMDDGTAAFPPQVGSGYKAFWLRDYAYMLAGNPGAFTDEEVKAACRLFVRSIREDGAGVDCVHYNGKPVYKPGYGSMGENPVADGSPFTIDVAWRTWKKTGDAELVKELADALVRCLDGTPLNPETGLVHIDPAKAWDRCPYGFTDSVRKKGDVLFSSLLYTVACRQLSELLDVAGRPAEAVAWTARGAAAAEAINRTFWDEGEGFYRAATVQCRELDVWGSAFAVHIGVADGSRAMAVADWLKRHYDGIVKRGQLRHTAPGVYWEVAGPRDIYQNGAYWATPVGWLVDALDRVDPGLADRTVLDMLTDFIESGDVNECINDGYANVPAYLASAALPLEGIRAVLKRRGLATGKARVRGLAPYGVGEWDSERYGNHRAVVRVETAAPAVRVRIPWRRRDAQPEAKRIIVIAAAGEPAVSNVVSGAINREWGEIAFEPAKGSGDYYVYYMPYRHVGSYFPDTHYLPAKATADIAWEQRVGLDTAGKARDAAWAALPEAHVAMLQAAREFDRFDPMEVPATRTEREAFLEANPRRPYLTFPEDRRYPIRMTDELPLRWVLKGAGGAFEGAARPGEYFVFQVGVFAARQALEALTGACGDLRNRKGALIPSAASTCFNLGGTDWRGKHFTKTVNVPHGEVQALWFGLPVPTNAVGDYAGTVQIGCTNGPATVIPIRLTVAGPPLPDGGVDDLWRQARLQWLNSTIGLDDDVVAPYTPVRVEALRIDILGRSLNLDATGLPAGIASTFTRSVDAIDAPASEILARPVNMVVETDAGTVPWQGGAVTFTRQAPGAVEFESTSAGGGLEMACHARVECDGYINYRVRIRAGQTVNVRDIRLEVPYRRAMARYMMGLGCKGGRRPAQWSWKWDVNRSNSHVWLGDVHGGLQCRLKGHEDHWEMFNWKETGIPEDWYNGGRGGCEVLEESAETVLVRASSGPRRLEAGQELLFRFGLLITPVKVLDKAHWDWRYWHACSPPEDVARSGANVINVHHATPVNPFINYPFVRTRELGAYIADAHARDIKVKLYYTIRELSNHTAELFALRSLNGEVFRQGDGFRLADRFTDPTKTDGIKGNAWLREHLIGNLVPAWHHPFGNGVWDAALAQTGLSRWHNYYLEGLNGLIRKLGVDGIYIDGLGYDREIMKRVRKVMDRARPGCLIDFHCGNHFHPQYGMNNIAGFFMEHFPYINSLWLGEGFNYNEPPDYWLIELSGIPFGLFGEMLGEGNPWRGMVYGQSNRLQWGGDPRELWKLWDAFGIKQARMIGYWDPDCPVKTGRDDVLATVYQREGRTLLALASWAPEEVAVPLTIDFARLGLQPDKAVLYAPGIPGFQSERSFRPGERIPVLSGRGWLLWIAEQPPEIPRMADLGTGLRRLFEDRFAGDRLDKAWRVACSGRPGTRVTVADGELRIAAAANAAACVEHTLPPGVRLVQCGLEQRTDQGATWGPGLALIWPDGKALRVMSRVDGQFGVDAAGRETLAGLNAPDVPTELAIRISDSDVTLLASQHDQPWQELARLPRDAYPGDPTAIRLGKMGPGSSDADFGTPGPDGVCIIRALCVLGP